MSEQFAVQSFGSLPSLNKSTPKLIVERLLNNDETWAKIWPCFSNGGVCGHKVMDLKVAVDIIREADATNLNELAAYRLTDMALGNVVKNAIRAKYQLGGDWKINGLNPKVAALLSHTPTQAPAQAVQPAPVYEPVAQPA